MNLQTGISASLKGMSKYDNRWGTKKYGAYSWQIEPERGDSTAILRRPV
jgi:hypothetical protein